MAAILWADADGSWTLRSSHPDHRIPGGTRRFSVWRPLWNDVQETQVNLATGAIVPFRFRTDHGVTLALDGIGVAPLAGHNDGWSMLDVAERLGAHLRRGGSVSVYPENGLDLGLVFLCTLMPGTEVTVEESDADQREFAWRATLRHTAATAMPFPYVRA